jgi:tetratricopeptide (TPR) repeat protein
MEPRPQVKPNEKVWLVKSAGQVLGPYSWLELADSIGSRQISLIDEVRDPWSRWGFVREHAQLKDLVNKIRSDDLNRKEDTSTADRTDHEITITQEITPVPEFDSATKSSVEKKHYADGKDKKIQKQLKLSLARWKLGVWVVASFVLIAVGISFYQNNLNAPRVLSAEDYLRLARQHRALGAYAKSLSFYRKAETLQPLDFSTRMQMIPLLLVVDNQILEARRWLDEIEKQGTVNATVKAELNNLRGLSYLKEGNLSKAEEEFKKSLSSQSQYGPAITNLVSTHLLEKKYSEVSSECNDLEKSGINTQVLILVQAISLLSDKNQNANDEARSVEKIEKLLKSKLDFRAESLLILTALYRSAHKADKEVATLKQLLDEVPDRMKDMNIDLQTDAQVLGWDQLQNICHSEIEGKSEQPEYQALDSFCLMAKGDSVAAIDSLSRLRQRQPTEIKWINLQSYFFKQLGRNSEASVLVKNFSGTELKLMNLVKGALCLDEKDLRCSESAFQAALFKDPMEVIAFSGLASIHLERNQKETAKEFASKGLTISPNYRPLLELMEEINGI